MSKKYVYGIINERSEITDSPIYGGRIIQTYNDELTGERVLIIQTSLGTIYEAFARHFVTDLDEISEIVNMISKKFETLKARYKKADETADRCMAYLNKQSTNPAPDIPKCFQIQGQYEAAVKEIEKLQHKLEVLRQSLVSCHEVTQKM